MAISDGRPRTATATVVEDTRCLVIEAKTLESMISRNAEIALAADQETGQTPRLGRHTSRDPMHRLSQGPCDARAVTPRGCLWRAHVRRIGVRTTPAELAVEVGVDVGVAHEVMARLREASPRDRGRENRSSWPTWAVCRTSSSSRDAAKARRRELRPRGAPSCWLSRWRDATTPHVRFRARRDAVHRTPVRSLEGSRCPPRRSSKPVSLATPTSDHIRDSRRLPTIATRCNCLRPLVVAGTGPTLAALRAHFF